MFSENLYLFSSSQKFRREIDGAVHIQPARATHHQAFIAIARRARRLQVVKARQRYLPSFIDFRRFLLIAQQDEHISHVLISKLRLFRTRSDHK